MFNMKAPLHEMLRWPHGPQTHTHTHKETHTLSLSAYWISTRGLKLTFISGCSGKGIFTGGVQYYLLRVCVCATQCVMCFPASRFSNVVLSFTGSVPLCGSHLMSLRAAYLQSRHNNDIRFCCKTSRVQITLSPFVFIQSLTFMNANEFISVMEIAL